MAESTDGGNRFSRGMVFDAKGRVENDRRHVAPVLKIQIREALSKNSEPTTGFEYEVEFQPVGAKKGEPVAQPKGQTWFRKEYEALDAAKEVAAAHVKKVAKELRDSGDAEAFKSMRRFLCVLRDHCMIEKAVVKGQKRVRFTAFDDESELLASGIAMGYFDHIDTVANIYFRERLSSDGKDWTSGKDRDGIPLLVGGQIKKPGSGEIEMFRELLGYAPTFIVTVDSGWWRSHDRRHREALIHRLLSSACYNAESKSFFIAKGVQVFAETLRQFPDAARPEEAELSIKLIEGMLRDGLQLDALNLTLIEAETKTDFAKVAPAKKAPTKGARVLETSNGASASESLPAAAVGH